MTAGSFETVDFTPNLFDNAILRPSVDSCAWSGDGRLAVDYTDDGVGGFTIAVLDESGVPITRIKAGAVLPEVDYWLPDNSGFIVQSSKASPAGSLTFRSDALLLDGTYRRLPFDVERMLGTIPAP